MEISRTIRSRMEISHSQNGDFALLAEWRYDTGTSIFRYILFLVCDILELVVNKNYGDVHVIGLC